MSEKKEGQAEAQAMSSKKMLDEANKEKKVIKFADRVALVIIKKTKHYRVGQKINPHPLVAEQLLKNKIAEKV